MIWRFFVLLFYFNLLLDVLSISNDEVEKDKRYILSKLRDKFLLEDPRIEEVLRKYDRSNYLPFQKPEGSYKDKYIYLGCGAEFSSPFVHGEALHLLRNHLRPGASVLEIGSGTGYLSTCMAELVQPNGSVVGLDLVSPLIDFSIQAALKHAPKLVETNSLKFLVADGRYGYRHYAPFDVIYTDCSHRSIPSVLIDQLKPGGRIVMTLGRTELPQYLIAIDKDYEGKTCFSRVRLRSKVPRLCSNLKEQDLFYQRLYPLKHSQYIPLNANGEYVGGTELPYYSSPRPRKLADLSLEVTKFNSEDLEHFADAERKYQEKIEQMGNNYDVEDNVVGYYRTQKTTVKTTAAYNYDMLYEDWTI